MVGPSTAAAEAWMGKRTSTAAKARTNQGTAATQAQTDPSAATATYA